ncbi:4-hydroxybenzoate octaprenyltransferase [Neptunicella marina]|uniref:4-hydroxybenzoate octaprenyltransferase n=1 Tax=Neptunicella marina TaxID=2125989 RepID=UPI003BB224ED
MRWNILVANFFSAFMRLTRLNKPIGIFLLLWPTYWAVWIAANGNPSIKMLVIFTLGVIVMRSAGCVINDFADRKVDGAVKRTAMRPLATGELSSKQALIIFFALLIMAFILVLQLNTNTIKLSVIAVVLASSYPFFKRFTHLPQVILGAAFGWGIPMAFMATNNSISEVAWWLFAANLCWTVAYDTQYAMTDRDDDLKVGIKSTAILFGRYDLLIIALLQITTLLLLARVGLGLGFDLYYYAGLAIAAGFFVYQYQITKNRDRMACFHAFLNNHYAGLMIWAGLLLNYYF